MILDLPIENENNDKLDRSRFVNAVVEEIASLEENKSTVIGLSGKWGSGKTSILNLTQEQLEQKSYFTSYFNPWRYKNEEILIEELFLNILKAVNRSESIKSKLNDLGEKLKKYSKFISLPKIGFMGATIDASETVQKAGEFVGEILDQKESLEKTKSEINKILNELAVPLVIFIDDIDRLSKKEIQQLFKLIKLTVDFNKIIYFIAFDEHIVSKSLAEEYGNEISDGEKFIEKIIQLPLRIPDVPKERKFSLTLDLLNSWLDKKNIVLDESDPLTQSFLRTFRGFHDAFIHTPRDSKRLANAISFTESTLRKEINLYDIVFIEAVRLFCRPVFEFIIDNTEVFFAKNISPSVHNQNSPSYENEKALLQSIIDKNEFNKGILYSAINHLFPYNLIHDSHYSANSIDEFKIHNSNQRIGIRTYLNKYLHNKIGEQEISDKEFFRLFEKINTETSFDNLLPEIKTLESFPKEYIKRRIRIFENNLSQQGVINIAKLYGLGEHFYKKKSMDDIFFHLHHRELIEILSLIEDKNELIKVLDILVTENNDYNFLDFLLYKSKEGYKNEFKEVQYVLMDDKEEDLLRKKLRERILTEDLETYINNSNGVAQFLIYNQFIEKLGKEEFDKKIVQYVTESKENFYRFLKSIISPVYSGFNHVKNYVMMDFDGFSSFEYFIHEDTVTKLLQQHHPLYTEESLDPENPNYSKLSYDEQITLTLSDYYRQKRQRSKGEEE